MNNSYTRRNFTKLALSALPAAALLSLPARLGAAAKPNSKVAGVQLGLNVPYSFGGKTMDADEVLDACVKLGVSGVELRTQPVEAFLGLGAELIAAKKGEAKDATAKKAEKVRAWRKSAPMSRVKDFRAKWENAGVLIEIVKVDGIFKMSDDELDYAFTLAKALGGRAISSEISHEGAELKRVGQFADKHKLMVGYHGHATTKPEHWEEAFALAKYNGANVDLGHFVAGNNTSPVPFLKKYHDRVTHVHLKDRKLNNGPNTPFGEGDTPIAEVLRLMRDNKWNFQGTIEFEYKVPEGSDRMTEIARALKFCRDALA
ncbi:MAG: sugar phosphate isomerase/epimerase [Verrucomicrobia bacterium]|nr:sugar phosphate isomerase/epimerase [Verrucomicrobiota bacterium]